jgi:hypothetical protein
LHRKRCDLKSIAVQVDHGDRSRGNEPSIGSTDKQVARHEHTLASAAQWDG